MIKKPISDELREKLRRSHLGQKAWNKGTGGCKRGHDPKLYIALPSGVFICFGCKHENTARYRAANRKRINLKGKVARYHMSIEEYEGLFHSQDGRCCICKCLLEEGHFRIDHNHKSGKVRGLLCNSCNSGIGLLKDSPEILLSALEYLKDKNG